MAGRFSVESVFRAVDRVTAPVSRMQNRVGKFTRSMERGFRRANRFINRAASGVWNFGKRVTFVGGALATGFVLSLNRMAQAADNLAKTARRFDMPVEDLQEWRFVAEQSGVETSLLESSMGAFTKRLGEARAGTGALTTLLKKSNPQLLRQLTTTKDTSKAFEIMLGAIRNQKTATDKAALASAAFSRAGLKLVNITHNSADAVNALREEQRQNGAITQKQAESAEAYNDAVNSLQKSLTFLLQSALLPMLPAFTKQVRAWREWIVTNRELIGLKVREFFTQVLQLLQKFGQAFEFVRRNQDTIGKVAATVLVLVAALKILTAVMTVVNLVMAANPVSLIVIGISALIAAVAAAIIWWDDLKAAFLSLPALIQSAWAPVQGFFESLWGSVTTTFNAALARITAVVGKVKQTAGAIVDTISNIGGGVSDFFGFGDKAEEERSRRDRRGRSVVSPQERTARTIEESRTTDSAEVTIRDETGRAEVTRGALGNSVQLQPSGAF